MAIAAYMVASIELREFLKQHAKEDVALALDVRVEDLDMIYSGQVRLSPSSLNLIARRFNMSFEIHQRLLNLYHRPTRIGRHS